MKKIRIFCQTPFLIEIENNSFFVDKDNFLEISPQKQVLLKCYPVDQQKTSLPFCFLLKQNADKILSNCENIKVYNFSSRCDVFVEPFYIYSQKIVKNDTILLKNTKFNIICYEDRIKIKYTGGEFVFFTPLENATFDNQFGYINILTTFNSKKNYIRFDTLTKKFFSICGEKIQIEEQEILTQMNLTDMLSQTKVCTYRNNNCLEYQNADFYTQNLSSENVINEKLVPYVFFENIQIGNFKNAQQFLCENLAQTLTEQTLKQFFGDIQHIELYSFDPLIYTIYSQDNANDYKIYMSNFKIQEIESL